jgi:hypothetical protein
MKATILGVRLGEVNDLPRRTKSLLVRNLVKVLYFASPCGFLMTV